MVAFKSGKPIRVKVESLCDLDALVGRHVLGENPPKMWQDSHALFAFDSEDEARQAIQDPYYQMFLPDVDWNGTQLEQVQFFRPYSSDINATLAIVDCLGASKPLQLKRNQNQWLASFGGRSDKSAETAPMAICLAALDEAGIEVEIDGLQERN